MDIVNAKTLEPLQTSVPFMAGQIIPGKYYDTLRLIRMDETTVDVKRTPARLREFLLSRQFFVSEDEIVAAAQRAGAK